MRGMVTIMEMGFTRFGHESNVREENRELKMSQIFLTCSLGEWVIKEDS